MIHKVLSDVIKIFHHTNIITPVQGSVANSVFTLSGICTYREKQIKVGIVHHDDQHFSSISITCAKLPKEKIVIGSELINLINCCLKYDHFKIDPKNGVVQLYAGVYNSLQSGYEDETYDDIKYGDALDVYSYGHLCMLILGMISRSYIFSQLFHELITATEPVSTVFANFIDNLTEEEKNKITNSMH